MISDEFMPTDHFAILKKKISKTPILRYFDTDLQSVVVVRQRIDDRSRSDARSRRNSQSGYLCKLNLKVKCMNYGVVAKEVLIFVTDVGSVLRHAGRMTNVDLDLTFDVGTQGQLGQ